MSDSLWPHGLQHTRLFCPSLLPEIFSNSCPLSWWGHPTISTSIVLFSCLQSFPASGSFLMNRLFASGGQSIGAAASASVLPRNIQDWFPLWLTGLISLQSRGEPYPTPQFKSINSSGLIFFMVQLPHSYTTTRKTIALSMWTFVGKMMSLLFNMLSVFVQRLKVQKVWLPLPSSSHSVPSLKVPHSCVSSKVSLGLHEQMCPCFPLGNYFHGFAHLKNNLNYNTGFCER